MAAKGMIVINEDRCKGCGLCVEACPRSVLRLADGRFNAKGYQPVEVVDMDLCTGCVVCAIVCPDIVFTVYRQKRPPKRAAASASVGA